MKENEEKSETAVFGPGEIKENDQCKDAMLSVVANAAQGAKEEEKYLLPGSMRGLSEEDQDLFYAEGLDPKDVAKMLESARANKGARALTFESQEEMVVDGSLGGICGIPSTSMALPQGHELGVVDGMAGEGEDPTKLSQGQNSGSEAFVGVRMRQITQPYSWPKARRGRERLKGQAQCL